MTMIAKATVAHSGIGRLPVTDEPGRQASTGWRSTEARHSEKQLPARAVAVMSAMVGPFLPPPTGGPGSSPCPQPTGAAGGILRLANRTNRRAKNDREH